jgi:hypothetical protein
MKQHKIGTLTLGILLIVFGSLFLARIFFPDLSYEIIFKLWPIIFISLGGEILITNYSRKAPENPVYDKTAFLLIILLTFFAMGLAIADVSIDYAVRHADIYIR